MAARKTTEQRKAEMHERLDGVRERLETYQALTHAIERNYTLLEEQQRELVAVFRSMWPDVGAAIAEVKALDREADAIKTGERKDES
jgi:peptidoglycan hydrolase CwlO-like protein